MKHLDLPYQDWIALEKELSRRSLSEFIKMSWHTIEPQNKYIHNWHADAMSDHLMASAKGEITRLLINVPPGTSKSTITSAIYPAWLWGPYGKPGHRVLAASFEAGLATRDNRKTRNLITSDWFQERWPIEIVDDQNQKMAFENKYGGFRQSSAVKSMTGKRGDTIIWDDPHSPEKAYSDAERETAIRVFQETLPLRVVSPEKSVIIIIMQRLHEEDISGHILKNDYGYTMLRLPMEFEESRRCYSVVMPTYMKPELHKVRYSARSETWVPKGTETPEQLKEIGDSGYTKLYNVDPRSQEDELLFEERFPRTVVERDKRVLGSFATAGQFQQRPTPRGGGMFKREWFKTMPAAPAGTRWVRAWDLAGTEKASAAYTAGVMMGLTRTGEYIVADARRAQITGARVEQMLRNTADQDLADYGVFVGSIPQDPGSAGKSWAQHLIKLLAGHNYRASPESGDKVTRAQGFAAQAEAGNVYLLAGPWNSEYLDELTSFPNSKWKDQVDASTRAFATLLDQSNYSLEGAL